MLNLNTGIGVLCGATAINEYGKYKAILETNREMAKDYKEGYANSKYLMKHMVNQVAVKDIFRYSFGIKFGDQSEGRKKYINNEFYHYNSIMSSFM